MKMNLGVSIEEADVAVLKDFCAKTGIPVSKLFQDYASAMVKVIRAVGADRKVKVSKLDMIRIFGKGLSEVP